MANYCRAVTKCPRGTSPLPWGRSSTSGTSARRASWPQGPATQTACPPADNQSAEERTEDELWGLRRGPGPAAAPPGHSPASWTREWESHIAVLLHLAGNSMELKKAFSLSKPHGRRLCPKRRQADLATRVVVRRRSLDVVFPRHGCWNVVGHQ